MHGETFRLPTSRDLALVAQERDASDGQAALAPASCMSRGWRRRGRAFVVGSGDGRGRREDGSGRPAG